MEPGAAGRRTPLSPDQELPPGQSNHSARPSHVSPTRSRIPPGSPLPKPDPWAQPLEPILVPRLRIHFADFPYLLYPMRPEAFHLGDLMRL
jgi:hypothetical protein